MAYTAPRTTVGFELNYNKAGFSGNPVPYELLPDTKYEKGMAVCMGRPGQGDAVGNQIIKATNSLLMDDYVFAGIMAETIEQADNPADKITKGLVYDNPYNVYRVTFSGQTEVEGASEGTTKRLNLTAVTQANNIRGSMLYIYEGPGKGCVRTIVGADISANWIEWYEAIASATTTATKGILLSADVDTAGVNVGSRGLLVASDSKRTLLSLNANGPLNVVSIDPKNLWMDVIFRPQAALF